MSEKHKICLLGATGVGKTSLVTRFVRRVFSDAYQTTIGVKIEKRAVRHDGRDVDLVIWDLTGEDEFQRVQLAYMRGAAGLLVVADGTRRDTADLALQLHATARGIVGEVPCVVILNKSDLTGTWEIDERAEAALRASGCPLVRTSAKTGAGVEEAFTMLTAAILGAGARAARGA